jgi:hypothetical protein
MLPTGPVPDHSPPWLIDQQLHLYQLPCVPAPIPVGSRFVPHISPGIDGSPRLIWNLSGSCQGPWWWPDCQKEYRCPTCVALPYILHNTRLNVKYFSLEFCGGEHHKEAVPPSWGPSVHPCTSAFTGLGAILLPEQTIMMYGLNLFCYSHLSGNLTMNGL